MHRLIAVTFLLLLVGCAPAQQKDLATEHLLACTGYTSLLEQIADNKDAGLYTEAELRVIRSVELRTTPLCEAPATVDGNQLILAALRQLNVYVLERAATEGA